MICISGTFAILLWLIVRKLHLHSLLIFYHIILWNGDLGGGLKKNNNSPNKGVSGFLQKTRKCTIISFEIKKIQDVSYIFLCKM